MWSNTQACAVPCVYWQQTAKALNDPLAVESAGVFLKPVQGLWRVPRATEENLTTR